MMLVHKDRTGHPVGERFRQTLETHTYSTGHKDTETSVPTDGVGTVSRGICQRRRQWERWSDIRRNTGGCVGETGRAGTKGRGWPVPGRPLPLLHTDDFPASCPTHPNTTHHSPSLP